MDSQEALRLVAKEFSDSDTDYEVRSGGDTVEVQVRGGFGGINFIMSVENERLVSKIGFGSVPGEPVLDVAVDDVKLVDKIKDFVSSVTSYEYQCTHYQFPRPIRRYCEYLRESSQFGTPEESVCPTVLRKCERCPVKIEYDRKKAAQKQEG